MSKKAFNLFFPALSAKHLWLCALKSYELISAIQCDCATMHEIVDAWQLRNLHEIINVGSDKLAHLKDPIHHSLQSYLYHHQSRLVTEDRVEIHRSCLKIERK
jgi:hypothetical protein